MSTDCKVIGDYWEYHVIMVALEKGAEVFRNTCCSGPIDIVLKINDEFIPIDVKQKTWKKRDGNFCAAHGSTIADGVWGVGVDPYTREVSWYRLPYGGHPRPFQCPQGLEDFWN